MMGGKEGGREGRGRKISGRDINYYGASLRKYI